jgi:L-fucose isomerase-like protein
MMKTQRITLGVIVGNRGFFPSYLCRSGREAVLRVLEEEGIGAVAVGPEDTEHGSVESLSDARKCAELFRAHREEIAGILVTLPNFGDERGVANALRLADLNVPVLVHAFPDVIGRASIDHRRDSFCGKISVCNNLRQYGIPFSLTELHTVDPESESFHRDLRWFAAVCRVARGMRRARFGVLGARPAAFNTVRFSEKLLERAGISVETLDLSEAFGRATALADDDPRVLEKIESIKAYTDAGSVPAGSIVRIAKLGVVIDDWRVANEYDATAIQCWTSMEEHFGVVPCTLMSMMSEGLAPSACESDIAGTAAMYALMLASGRPSALLDWNNNYGEERDKGVVFHCSNLPRSMFVEDRPPMHYQEIIAGTVGKDRTWGTIGGRLRAGPFTFLRISTDDLRGAVTAYVGEGSFTDDPFDSFGGYGVVQVPGFQELLRHICENGYEHHVAVNPALVAGSIHEALTKYLGWDVYYHRRQ